MTHAGAFTFVLHSHLPYARLAGRWPHGEEWLHEAAAETYIPLLDALFRLLEEGIRTQLTINLSPVLLEQLADHTVQEHFRKFLQDRIKAIQLDVDRFEKSGQSDFLALARLYLDEYLQVQRSFDERYGGDLINAFRQLQHEGIIEITTCAATHGFLPLLARDESIELQLKTAVEAYQRHFDRLPSSIWLPECAYRPATVTQHGTKRDGLESFLGKYGLNLFFAESKMVQEAPLIRSETSPKGRSLLQRTIQWINSWLGRGKRSTFQPYYVGSSKVAVLARNQKVSLQVWSADWGFPGDFAYREFHKRDGNSGMRYWRITGSGTDLGAKERYDPRLALQRVQEHVDHFHNLVLGELERYRKRSGEPGIIAANFDTELFGHWWYEGTDWLEAVLRKFAESDSIQLLAAGQYVGQHTPQQALDLQAGSWGAGGDYSVWDNDKTHWMWPIIHDAEARMVDVVRKHSSVHGLKREIIDQAARELLLLQSSDWPFLVTTGQADRYAVRRFLQHVERFNQLIRELDQVHLDRNLLDEIWQTDKIFPEIDHRWFKS